MKKKPLISVIINCRNGEKFLNECVKSVLFQSYKNWEIIFFDNKSIDKSLDIIKSFRDPRIKIFSNKSKSFLNLYEARNLAIKKSKGQYITFLDVDDLWKKNKLIEQVKILNNFPVYDIIYSNYHLLNTKNKKFTLPYKKKLPSGLITQELLNNYCVAILTLFIKKELLIKNKFNSRFNIIGDFDLVIRLSKKYKIKAIQKSLAVYRLHSNNFSAKNLATYIQELSFWIKKNNKLKYNLFFLKYYLKKLKIKKIINF